MRRTSIGGLIRTSHPSPSTMGLMSVLLVAMACGPTQAERPAAPMSQSAVRANAPQAPSSDTKTIVVGQGFEMQSLNRLGRNDTEADHVVNAGLVTRDTEKYQVLPWMAEALPSLDNGSWQLNQDGT